MVTNPYLLRHALTIRLRRLYGARRRLGGAMTKMEQAIRRLEQAVARLEQAARRAADGEAAVKAEFTALADTTQGVASRLDAVIGRLNRVLEG